MSDNTEPDKPKRKVSNAELDNIKNYLVVNIAYDLSICLPYKDGIAFIAALENAEMVTMDRYGNKPLTFKLGSIEIHSFIVTQHEYREQKMNHLLGVTDE